MRNFNHFFYYAPVNCFKHNPNLFYWFKFYLPMHTFLFFRWRCPSIGCMIHTPHEIFISFVTGPSERIASLTCILSSCILFYYRQPPCLAAKSKPFPVYKHHHWLPFPKRDFNWMYQRTSKFVRELWILDSRKLLCLYNGHFWQCAGLYCTRFLRGMPH